MSLALEKTVAASPEAAKKSVVGPALDFLLIMDGLRSAATMVLPLVVRLCQLSKADQCHQWILQHEKAERQLQCTMLP